MTFDTIYSRTARFYTRLLSGGTEEQWSQLMATTTVVLTADVGYTRSPGAQLIVCALANLLGRCFRSVELEGAAASLELVVDPVLISASTLGDAVRSTSDAIHGDEPRLEPARTLRVHVGARPAQPWIASVWASGGRAFLWPPFAAPEGLDGEPNPLGAFVAAVLGATSVTRDFLERVTQPSDRPAHKPIAVDGARRMRYASPLGLTSVSAHDLFEQGRPEPPFGGADLGPLRLVSLGAVNGALLYLIRLSGLLAGIEAIEPDRLDRSNLNRYLYALARFVGAPKLTAAGALVRPPMSFVPHPVAVEGLSVPFGANEVVVCGPDKNTARWEAQRRTRGWLLSLETEGEGVTVSTHDQAGPCIRCLHPSTLEPDPLQPTHPVVSAWAGVLGLAILMDRSAGLRSGRQIRQNALAPGDRVWEDLKQVPGCPGCADRERSFSVADLR